MRRESTGFLDFSRVFWREPYVDLRFIRWNCPAVPTIRYWNLFELQRRKLFELRSDAGFGSRPRLRVSIVRSVRAGRRKRCRA